MLKYQKCENCGAGLVEKDGKFVCEYCKNTYTDNSLEKAYEKVCTTLRSAVEEVVSEGFLNAKIEKIASCRQGLYRARTSEYIDNADVKEWSDSILKLLPDDPQANFYSLASTKRWTELNVFLKTLDPMECGYLLEGFVDYLTNGQFVERCILRLNDLIDIAFDENSDEYKNCHKKIVNATEKYSSGTFDVSLPRDVFVAYSSRDKEQAYELVEYLEECGLRCFISMRNLPKGVDAKLYYEKRLKQAIDNCQVFVLVSSKNSRSRDCDAYSVEIAYVKECDLKKSDDVNYYRNNYDIYVEKYREKCKPRIEFLIEEYGKNIYETQVKNFFKGLSWCVDKDGVVQAVSEYITNGPIENGEKEKQELARQKEEFERQKNAELERQKAEFEKQRLEMERQKAEFERQKAEIERQKIEMERQKMELELNRQKAELERQKAEKPVEIAKPVKAIEPVGGITLHNELFDIDNGVLTKYKGTQMFTDVPEGTVTIESYAFNNNETLYTISLPDSVRTIKSRAINNCKKLVSIGIPKFVERIESYAFFGCIQKFTAFVEATSQPSGWDNSWGANCPEIKWGARVNPGRDKKANTVEKPVETAKPVEVAKPVETKPVQKVEATKAPKFTAAGADYSIKSAKQALVDFEKDLAEMQKRQAEEKAKKENSQTPDFEIENGVLKKYNGKSENVVIPDGVEVIEKYAFSKCLTIKSVKMPSSVTDIRYAAFEYCKNLQKVELSNSLKKIGNDAFLGCMALESISIPPSVINIGLVTFSACTSLKEVDLSPNLKKIGTGVFNSCFALKKVKIPSGVTELGEHAFTMCNNLESIFIPSTVKTISDRAFEGCPKLTIYTDLKEKPVDWKIGRKPIVFESNEDGTPTASSQRKTSLEENVEKLKEANANKVVAGASSTQNNDSDFKISVGLGTRGPGGTILEEYKGNKEHVIIPKRVRQFKYGVFNTENGKKITTLEFEEGFYFSDWYLKTVDGITPFTGLFNVKKIIIPASMTNIPYFLITASFNVEEFIVAKENPNYCSIEGHLYSKDRTEFIRYASGKKATTFVLPDCVESISNCAFEYSENLTHVRFPTTPIKLGHSTFTHCENLISIEPFYTYRIPANTFLNCFKLSKIHSGLNNVTDIESCAFYGCRSLTEINLDGVKHIHRCAFYQCISLRKVYISSKTNGIDEMAFYGCRNLTIYAEEKKKPSGWKQSLFKKNENWNPDKRPVKWGAKLSDYENNK